MATNDTPPDWVEAGQRVEDTNTFKKRGTGTIEEVTHDPGAMALKVTCRVKWDSDGVSEPLIDPAELKPIR